VHILLAFCETVAQLGERQRALTRRNANTKETSLQRERKEDAERAAGDAHVIVRLPDAAEALGHHRRPALAGIVLRVAQRLRSTQAGFVVAATYPYE